MLDALIYMTAIVTIAALISIAIMTIIGRSE